MKSIEAQLSVMVDSLQKKENALTEIANITENQSVVWASALTEDEKRAFIVPMNKEKQAFIQTVLQCDAVFENMLKEVVPVLDENPDGYKAQITALKEHIKRVTDLDVRIRVCEDNNDSHRQNQPQAPTVIKQLSVAEKPAPRLQNGNWLIKAYKENMKG